MPSGGLTSVFSLPMSFQLVESTVPPLSWWLKMKRSISSDCLEWFVHGPLGLITCISIDLLEHLVQSSLTFLIKKSPSNFPMTNDICNLFLIRLCGKGFVNFCPITPTSIRCFHTSCSCSWNSSWKFWFCYFSKFKTWSKLNAHSVKDLDKVINYNLTSRQRWSSVSLKSCPTNTFRLLQLYLDFGWKNFVSGLSRKTGWVRSSSRLYSDPVGKGAVTERSVSPISILH